ncbi:uncharacterized protein LTR77_007158 [Saxophila tyrrhenica]|uniref:Major facilitator superfamily (MFS) profile domain-containing protein n=1 Tax=Saxophila tyrrhenica TaxID=1690608 RepID=A0AAV9P3T4_9PEZI|nr:hypothetical protein LTR77_007158 [Saxophila tyrrhenica]
MSPRFISEHATKYNYFCAITVCTGSLLWGYDSGIFATAQAQEYFEIKFHPSPSILGAIISTYTAGGAVGCLFSWPIGHRAGRRGTMRIGGVIAIIGTTLQTAAVNVGMLITGRLIAGLAIGIIYFAIPQYQSEIAPPEHRGSIVGLHPQFIGFGYALSNWIGFAVSYSHGQFTYAFPVGLQILWAVILLVCTFFLPESPRFLIEQSRNEDAFNIMKRFRKGDEAYVRKEFKQMVDQINWEQENEVSSIVGIMRKPSYRKRLFLGCFVQFAQQICGISAINYYQTKMYVSLGIRGPTVLALAGVWGLTGPLANLFCLAFVIDRVKRRTMFIWGSFGMALDISIVMAIVAIYSGGPNTVANSFGVVFLILFGVIFSLSWNAGAPVYCTEIFPQNIRATGGAIGTFMSFLVQVILAQASPTALNNVGWQVVQWLHSYRIRSLMTSRRYYIFFLVLNLFCAACVWFLLPETFGKSLEEVSEVFGDTFVTIHMDDAVPAEKLQVTNRVEGVELKA